MLHNIADQTKFFPFRQCKQGFHNAFVLFGNEGWEVVKKKTVKKIDKSTTYRSEVKQYFQVKTTHLRRSFLKPGVGEPLVGLDKLLGGT